MSETMTPSVGRRIWYWTGTYDSVAHGIEENCAVIYKSQPLDAGVLCVHPDGTVNLDVTDHRGRHHFRADVVIVDAAAAPDCVHGGVIGCAAWMPYQRNQAAKS